MHRLRITKAHFSFCRMHIDIHCTRIEREFKHEPGRCATVHLISHCVANGVQNHFVAHPATVHEQMLRVSIGHGAVGLQHKAFDGQQSGVNADFHTRRQPLRAKHRSYA